MSLEPVHVPVPPTYAAISAVADICDPWIELWAGDEWGESMRSLHGACHTDYGFSDEDCALFASKLIENLQHHWVWVVQEGYSYGYMSPRALERVRIETCGRRDYWLRGGNLGSFGNAKEHAATSINAMPSWLFNKQEFESREPYTYEEA